MGSTDIAALVDGKDEREGSFVELGRRHASRGSPPSGVGAFVHRPEACLAGACVAGFVAQAHLGSRLADEAGQKQATGLC